MSPPSLLNGLRQRVLLCDGGFGSRIQAMKLDVERDYGGKENCTEILNITRPDLVKEVHASYFTAGADVVETNSFGGSPITLGEFGLGDRAAEINRIAALIAREAADEAAAHDGDPRYVLGSIGPGTRLPSLGHIAYDALEDAFAVQATGLVEGGVDGILIETCQDLLQIKAAINGARRAIKTDGRDVPVMVQVTVETTGSMLTGSDIAAAATVMQAMRVDSLGLNCATGPREMAEHLRWLAQNWPGLISCQPNAGLPELVDGKAHYPLSPADLAMWMGRFLDEDGLNMLGGCCGTNIEHIAALDAMLRARAEPGQRRPLVKSRSPHGEPAVASLFQHMPLRQENAVFSIGERCNANGSKQWRQLQEKHDWDGCLDLARQQVAEGAHALDICTAFVGRDEMAEMAEVVRRFATAVTVPLVIDTTELPVLEHALPLYGGKAIINSINFEDGEAPARKRLELARRYGCAVIALTIDEQGMARTPERKLAIARRLHDLACGEYGLPSSDLLIDPLTFTIATGQEDDRKLALWTLEGIELIKQALPECQIMLGLSNVSFGLNPAARQILNSVFLDHARGRGMTAAIIHAAKILPLHKIAPAEREAAEALIFDRRAPGFDPLSVFVNLFEGRAALGEESRQDFLDLSVEERLKRRIVDGNRKGLDDDLRQAMQAWKPLDIVNTLLLDGMKTVGELFGSGKMQLPFVLQSAETMKAAVSFLEPFMERQEDAQPRGTMVLATVKGDVHDIGKNLVDIILTNNGYRVINLGIKQPLDAMIQALKEHKADAIGMSGLLVKSTQVMKENLEEMTRQGLNVPVLLGGAALTRAFVEEDCARAYPGGRVAYGGDAFDGLFLMDKISSGDFDSYVQARAVQQRGRGRRPAAATPHATLSDADRMAARARRGRMGQDVTVPDPPFWGARMIESVSPKALLPLLNERMLFQMQWGYRKEGRSLDDYMDWARRELRPVLQRLMTQCQEQNILQPAALYGYWRCAGEGNDLVLFEPDGITECGRFTLPRQTTEDGDCIADFFKDIEQGPSQRDVVGLQVVTMGARASDIAHDWFTQNRYQDYLYLHGLSVEMTEALAEHVHHRIRSELGFADQDARETEKLLNQGYHGSRYSFGYPACPALEDQSIILRLLGAQRLGVTLSEEHQLHPEQSTSALVVHHPKARYFGV